MPTIVHGFDWPDRIVVGTVGRPGSRSFYLQVRAGDRVVSVGLEKEQSATLAEKIDETLDELRAEGDNPFHVPAETPLELVDTAPLDQPVEPEFRTAVLSLGWDPSTLQIVIEAYAFPEDDDEQTDEVEPPEMLVVRIPVGAARAFAKRTLEIVGAGRALCPLCGAPMDPEGHRCPELDDLR